MSIIQIMHHYNGDRYFSSFSIQINGYRRRILERTGYISDNSEDVQKIKANLLAELYSLGLAAKKELEE